ncbi:hypothetical protein GM3708_159 [Geminocystis sp. NIES-3708]|uniref:DUF3887 domain-containing protein n=1 Tax=Geminocystis sp. NIES-3708 TaxID=1615909 RepID=UPI0005FC71FD|nr:DUF3887 domain-containing protein [Geminocystis sp. NIES-3708]BAQ59754.1 hypothetical protein GM3708_159 [Geminocystis sp. NIES-3708]
MKISRFVTVGCLSVILGGLSYQTSSYAQTSANYSLIAQNNNQDQSSQLEVKGKEIINLFFAEKFDSVIPLLSPQLRGEISQELIKKNWDETIQRNGKFKNIQESKVMITPGSDLAIFTLNFDKITEDWVIIFNDQQEIIGLDIPTSQNIDTISRNFINSLVSSDSAEARAYLHPFLKEKIFPQQLQSRWNSFTEGKGEFKGITTTTVRSASKSDDTDIVIMDLEFSQNKEQIFVIFDDSKSIIGVDFIQ